MCASPGVVAVPELQGNLEAEFCAEKYVDDTLNLEARGKFGEERWNDVFGSLAGLLANVRRGSFNKRHL